MGRPKRRAWDWWANPRLWYDDEEPGIVDRPAERAAIRCVRRQAARRRLLLLRLIVALERWSHDHHPQVSPFVRIHLIARRLDMTPYQVSDALQEAAQLMDAGVF